MVICNYLHIHFQFPPTRNKANHKDIHSYITSTIHAHDKCILTARTKFVSPLINNIIFYLNPVASWIPTNGLHHGMGWELKGPRGTCPETIPLKSLLKWYWMGLFSRSHLLGEQNVALNDISRLNGWLHAEKKMGGSGHEYTCRMW